MSRSKAVYAGTYDPFTNGHYHVLSQALPLFEEINLAIGINPAKKTMLSLADRQLLLADVAKTNPKIVVSAFENEYLVNYAQRIEAQYIIRGLRNTTDFEYELSLAQINQKINPRIRTVFFMADRAYADISSSTVKALIGPVGWEEQVRSYIPEVMWDRFIKLAKVS
jgi:pantetheine-phosphate adenylyltransferase